MSQKRRRGEGLPDWRASSRDLFEALYPSESKWAALYEDALDEHDRRLGIENYDDLRKLRTPFSRHERETSVWADVRYFQRVLALEFPGHRGEYLDKALRVVAADRYGRPAEPTEHQVEMVRRLARNARQTRKKDKPE